MKKSILLIFAMFITNLVPIAADSKMLYASKSVILSSVLGKSTYASSVVPVGSKSPRDYKIPDDESDSTPYSDSSNSPDLILNGVPSVKTLPWKGPKLVVLDPGHGGYDPGAGANGLVEKDINLDVSLKVNKILRDSSVLVLLTRKTDVFVDTRERIEQANREEAAMFVSIHSNWMKDPSLHGSMTLYYPSKNLSSGYLNEIDYALTIQKEFMNGLEIKDRGIIDRPNLTVLKHANMPSVLIELGFMSNPFDASMLASDSFRQKAAEGIAKGILASLSKIDEGKQ